MLEAPCSFIAILWTDPAGPRKLPKRTFVKRIFIFLHFLFLTDTVQTDITIPVTVSLANEYVSTTVLCKPCGFLV